MNIYNSCKEVCGQEKHCGNRYCSLHPHYYGPKTKKKKEKSTTAPVKGSFSSRSYLKRPRNYNRKPKY